MNTMIGGRTESSRYLEVWEGIPVNPGCATSAAEMERSHVTYALSAPRHWEAPQAAPAAACQDPCPEPQTDGSARDFPPFTFTFESVLGPVPPYFLPALGRPVPILPVCLTQCDEESIMPVLVFISQPKVRSGII